MFALGTNNIVTQWKNCEIELKTDTCVHLMKLINPAL